jgi:hypothetical protein
MEDLSDERRMRDGRATLPAATVNHCRFDVRRQLANRSKSWYS